MPVLTILGAILGQKDIFQVKLNSDETVLDLKERIKEKNVQTLRDFDAHQLTLYKLDLPFNRDNFKSVLVGVQERTVVFRDDQQLGFSLDKLSVLGSFPDGAIHILVVPSTGESIKTTICADVGVSLSHPPAHAVPDMSPLFANTSLNSLTLGLLSRHPTTATNRHCLSLPPITPLSSNINIFRMLHGPPTTLAWLLSMDIDQETSESFKSLLSYR